MGNPNGRAVAVAIAVPDPAVEPAVQGGAAIPLLCTPQGVLYTSDVSGLLPPPAFPAAGASVIAFDTPAAATAPDADAPATGVGFTNVLKTLTVTLNAVAAQPVLTVVVRDGATGAGAILYSFFIGPLGAAQSQIVHLPNLNIAGSDDTEMTVETTAAPAATNFCSIAWTGNVGTA